MEKQNIANTVIDRLGGTSAVAELTELTTGAISLWRRNGIPDPWLRLFKATRPDVFENINDDGSDPLKASI